MPVLNDVRARPAWCELESYAIREWSGPSRSDWLAEHPANKLVVVDGSCDVVVGEYEHHLGAGAVLDVAAGTYRLAASAGTGVVLLGGHWSAGTGGSGVFGLAEEDDPHDGGDPVDYEKRTSFDRHFHDCDEYWIIVRGRGTAVTEGVHHAVGPGDCVATRMGDHHDFPLVDEPVRAVYFETTMRGSRRPGHLWEHTHGPAVPAARRSEVR